MVVALVCARLCGCCACVVVALVWGGVSLGVVGFAFMTVQFGRQAAGSGRFTSPKKTTWRVVASLGADGAAARLVPAPGFGALSGSIPGRAFVVHRYRRPLDSHARMKASRGQSSRGGARARLARPHPRTVRAHQGGGARARLERREQGGDRGGGTLVLQGKALTTMNETK